MQIQVHNRGVEFTSSLAEFLSRQIHFALNRYQGKVRRVRVQLSDCNGPRGGVDKECMMTLKTPWEDVVVREEDANLYAAIARATDRAARAMERQNNLQRSDLRRPVRDRPV